MTAVLVVIVRVAGYAILGLAALASILWAALSPPGLATMAWLAVMFVTVTGCGVALEWLGKRRRKEGGSHAGTT